MATTEKAGSLTQKSVSATFKDGKLSGTKLPVADGAQANFAIVLAKEGKGLSLVVVDLDGAGVERHALKSMDPTRPQAKLRFHDAPATRPETGQLRLDRNLIVISVLSGGREKGPSFSYSPSRDGFLRSCG
jgi:alkylation response protein AidB-like acyl-CoA dehydrogenase